MVKFFAKVGFINVLIMLMFTYLEQAHKFYLRDVKGSAVVKITNKGRETGGTGFGVEYEGQKFIMTNAHVCRIEKLVDGGIWVNLPDGKQKKATVLKVFKKHDLCLIKHIEGLTTLSLGSDPQLGQIVHAVGFPALQPKTLTTGEYVGDALVQVGIEMAYDVLQFKECRKGDQIALTPQGWLCIRTYVASFTTTPIIGGSSGSPMINSYGNLVGVVFAGSSEENNWAKVVPLDAVKEFLYNYTQSLKGKR